MKKWIIFFCFSLLCCYPLKAQDTIGVTTAAKWDSDSASIDDLLWAFQSIYAFQSNEKIASIGAGQGIREVIYSLAADSLTFYLQDINPFWLELDKVDSVARKIYKQMGRTNCLATFVPARGREKETRLPKQFFDKILIENSLHEFNYQTEMLQSVRNNLKEGGQLFIWEDIAKQPGRKHPGCEKPIFTEEALVKLVEETGFLLVEKIIVYPPDGTDMVFRFRLK